MGKGAPGFQFALMCAHLCVQSALSGQLSSRNFLCRPPEPTPGLLLSPPASSIYLGKTNELSVPFYWNPSILLNPHLCVVGMTGSGKSYFVKTFITRARLVLGTNALILDWAGEYSDWVKAAGGKAVSLSSEGINLLDPGGTSPHNRMLLVLQSLDILTDLSTFPHQRRLTSQAIQKCYEQKGFPLSETAKETHRKNSKRLPPPPTLEDV